MAARSMVVQYVIFTQTQESNVLHMKHRKHAFLVILELEAWYLPCKLVLGPS